MKTIKIKLGRLDNLSGYGHDSIIPIYKNSSIGDEIGTCTIERDEVNNRHLGILNIDSGYEEHYLYYNDSIPIFALGTSVEFWLDSLILRETELTNRSTIKLKEAII